jgi:hypothetical protein
MVLAHMLKGKTSAGEVAIPVVPATLKAEVGGLEYIGTE